MDEATAAPRPGALRGALLATLGYCLLAVGFTWPAAAELGSHVLGGGWDVSMFLWNTWWGAYAAFDLGADPLITEHLFHPDGTSLAVNTHCLLPALISAPLQAAFGLVPAFNLMILLSFALSGLGIWLLALELGMSRRAAFVAGAIFAFGHFRVSKIMFFNLIHTEFLALFAWALWRALRLRSFRAAAVAGCFGGAVLHTSYNHFVFALLLGVALGLGFGISAWRRRDLGPMAARAALAAGLTGLLSLPLALRFQHDLKEGGDFVNIEGTASYDEAVPLKRMLVRGPFSGREGDAPYPARQACFLGYSTLLLAALGLLTRLRRGAAWGLSTLAAVFLGLALGPTLNLTGFSEVGADSGIDLPYRTLRELPVLREVRIAHRYGLVGWLALAVLAGLGADALLRLVSGRGRALQGLVTAALVIVPVAEFAEIPFPKLQRLPTPPAALEQIAADERTCCVLEFPAGRMGYPLFSYFDTVHKKPVYLEGQLARTPPALRERQKQSALREALLRVLRQGRLPPNLSSAAATFRQEVADYRIGWVILSWIGEHRMVRSRESIPRPTLEALDTLIQRTLPVEEVVHAATWEEVEAWKEAEAGSVEGSAACFYRVYRVALD